MSLFDIIKYPIDIRFRLEDLKRIPSKVLWIWCKEDLCIDPMLSSPKAILSYFYSYAPIMTGNRMQWLEVQLKALQRRIQEHDG